MVTVGLAGLKAVILVGGPGTRLQPLTNDVPKSVVPVLNRPFLEHTIAYLKQFGIEDVILTLNYLPDVIREYFSDGRQWGVRLAYCLEMEPLGTAGAVKNAEAYLDSTFVVLNGDIFTDLDLADMVACHRANKAMVTISLNWVDDPSAYGVVETDGDRRVGQFIEKPPREEATTNWINAGTYVIEPEVLKHIPAETHCMFERQLFPRLLEINEPVYGYPHRGYWLDMGTLEKYYSLTMDLLSARTYSPLIQGLEGGRLFGPGVTVHSSAVIEAPVMVGRGCQVGPGVSLKGPVVIGEGCSIARDASIENAILWDNIVIGANARITRSIISGKTVIGPGEDISDQVVTPSHRVPLTI